MLKNFFGFILLLFICTGPVTPHAASVTDAKQCNVFKTSEYCGDQWCGKCLDYYWDVDRYKWCDTPADEELLDEKFEVLAIDLGLPWTESDDKDLWSEN